MKKIFVGLFLLSLFVILLSVPMVAQARGLMQGFRYAERASATQPPADGEPVTLPDYVPVLLAGAIGWLFTEGLKSLSKVLPGLPNLEGQSTAIVGALVTIIVVIGNTLLALLPPEWKIPVGLFFGTIGSILAAYGYAGLKKKFEPAPVEPRDPELEQQ